MERITIDFSYKIEQHGKDKNAFVYFENLTIEDTNEALKIAAALINKATGEELDGIVRLENKEDLEQVSSEDLQKDQPKYKINDKVSYKGGVAPKNETETITCKPIPLTFVHCLFDINGWKYIIEHPQGFTKDVYIEQAEQQELKNILNGLKPLKYIMVPEEDLLPA